MANAVWADTLGSQGRQRCFDLFRVSFNQRVNAEARHWAPAAVSGIEIIYGKKFTLLDG